MRTDGVSSLAYSRSMRAAAGGLQARLAEAQLELATGRHADLGLKVGYRVSLIAGWRGEIAENEARTARLNLASATADVSQSALTEMTGLVQSVMAVLTAARGAGGGRAMARQSAGAALEQLTSLLSTTFAGRYVFGGLNDQEQPLRTYPGSDAKAAVDQAILSGLGVSQHDAAFSAITADAMNDFLQNGLAAEFDETAWVLNWTAATADVPAVRLDDMASAVAASSAHAEVFRKFAEALTMVSELAQDHVGQPAFEAVIDRALSLLGESQLGLGAAQAAIGHGEARISGAIASASARTRILMGAVSAEEAVDPYEVTTRINMLMTQLEASYTVTSRLSGLSLVRFI